MNNNNSGKLAFTILSISLLTVMAGAAIAPALGIIRDHFADAHGPAFGVGICADDVRQLGRFLLG